MNSLNYPQAARTESSPQWEAVAMAAPRTPSRPDIAQHKQRALVSAVVAAIQVVFVAGLVMGLAKTPDHIELPPMIVTLMPALEKHAPPPPPPPPVMIQPLVANAIALPTFEIYTPPPLVELNAPPSPITATSVAPKADPAAAVAAFQVKLVRHLNKNKRYPATARNRHEQGTVLVRFTMDRGGNVIAVALEKGCRYPSLNEEGLALLKRAQPLPPPPPEVEGATIDMVVPVDFSLKELAG